MNILEPTVQIEWYRAHEDSSAVIARLTFPGRGLLCCVQLLKKKRVF